MSLRYALLGFLTTEQASGYRLTQEFGESMGWFWYASHSQIYPELRRMEAEGLVTSELDGDDGRGKRTYTITDTGRGEFDRWLVEDADYPPQRDAERIRLVFLDQQHPDVIAKHLRAHRDHHQRLLDIYADQLEQIRSGTFPRLRKRLASQPPESAELVTGLKALALEGNARRARTEVEWADQGLLWLTTCTTDESRRH